jgi:rare lipoprotein A
LNPDEVDLPGVLAMKNFLSVSCHSLVRIVVPATALALGACASAPPSSGTAPAQTQQGRYQMQNDSGALEPIDLSQVKPVIPRIEARTAAGNKSPYTINGVTYRVLESEEGYSEVGMASWYGRQFHGHLTSNGERYDMFQLTAAHTRLPIPSYIRVTNLDNGKSVIARVNDRGPFHPGRVVDLSYAGASMLGYAGNGTARVRVEAIVPEIGRQNSSGVATVLTPAAPVAGTAVETGTEGTVAFATTSIESVATERQRIDRNEGSEYLQVGAFASLDSAQRLVARLNELTGAPVTIHSDPAADGKVLHKVRIGPLAGSEEEDTLIESVQRAQLGKPFKVRI